LIFFISKVILDLNSTY